MQINIAEKVTIPLLLQFIVDKKKSTVVVSILESLPFCDSSQQNIQTFTFATYLYDSGLLSYELQK